MSDPSEYLKLKYQAPPGACKCGNCQLVPPEMLAKWEKELSQFRAITSDAEYNARSYQRQS